MSEIIPYVFFFSLILTTVCPPSFLLFCFLFFLFLFISIYIRVCVCACTCACMHMCVLRCWDKMTMSGIFFSHFPFYFCNRVSLNLEFTHLAWLAGQQAPGIPTQVLVLVQHVLYQLSYFPALQYMFSCVSLVSLSVMVQILTHAINCYL